MPSKKIILAFIIFWGFFSLSGCEFNWRRYSSKEYGFSLLLPANWEEVEERKTVIMLRASRDNATDRFQETINVVVTEFPTDILLSTFFELNKEELLRVFPAAFNIMESNIFAGRVFGKLLTFDGRVEDTVLRVLTACWIKNKRAYVVTCVAEVKNFPKYSRLFKKVLGSMRIH